MVKKKLTEKERCKDMSFEEIKAEKDRPTPYCLYEGLEKTVRYTTALTVANTVFLILFTTVFK